MGILAPFRGLRAWYARQSRITSDLIIIGLVGAPIYLGAVWYQALDRMFELQVHHTNHELDWLVLLLVCMGIGAKIFSVRRVIDLHREVALRRKAEAEAHHQARCDVLTGLPNRRWFMEHFDERATGLAAGEACALLLVDLDNFKPINDVYGHRLGDEVLRAIAKRLMRLAEGDASVARLGGDEFGIVLRYRSDSDAPERLARQIVQEVPQPIPLAALALQVGVSVGIATCGRERDRADAMATRDGALVETMLRQADMAMYWAKAGGRGRYAFFDRSMDEKLEERVELEAQIRGAIAKGEIVPYYQRVVDLKTSRTIGFEILARWEHPTRGVLDPDVFIPIAENTGTIGELTNRLLDRALHDAKSWPEHLTLWVNFSPRQISDPMLPQRLLNLLTKAAFPAYRLIVEITEGAVVQKLDEARAVLQSLRKVGVRIALDDFGTGYSGMYHLRELKLDTIKIDRSYVEHMLDKADEAKLVKAIVSLGRALGLRTTAEGIESKDVADQLLKLGCDVGQGFLFGKPAPASSITATLREEQGAGEASARIA